MRKYKWRLKRIKIQVGYLSERKDPIQVLPGERERESVMRWGKGKKYE